MNKLLKQIKEMKDSELLNRYVHLFSELYGLAKFKDAEKQAGDLARELNLIESEILKRMVERNKKN